ncbi:MAG: hypothetical protein RLO18_22510, partial [Gimesia chilikensis]
MDRWSVETQWSPVPVSDALRDQASCSDQPRVAGLWKKAVATPTIGSTHGRDREANLCRLLSIKQVPRDWYTGIN